ncbi:MAG: TonB-dependent receptor plug domain-containing protein, partial [Planctomycetota bacterium]
MAPGLQTLADRLRLSPEVRTRELSNGPTVEAVELRGGGTGRTEIVLGSRSLGSPGTSGPFSHEAFLSEISGARILRGGAAALYGPDAASGAVVLEPAMPIVDDLTTRAFAEEGVDGYQRAGFQASRYWGTGGGFFITTESRRVDGFFPGTKQVDRHLAARVVGHLRGGLESEAGYRHYRGDGRDNGFSTATIGSILTKRTDWHANVFRSTAPGRGTLAEFLYRDERLENVGRDSSRTRDLDAPTLRITTDFRDLGGMNWKARVEGTRWRIEEPGTGVDVFWRGAAALRGTLPVGPGAGLTVTGRLDAEETRREALQARAEGWWTSGVVRAFAV